jgi:methylated-DNA-[protein]-cysteine S-methyltransferase
MDAPTATAIFDCPIGSIILHADDLYLRSVTISTRARPAAESSHPILAAALNQMREWLAGKRQGFDLPLAPLGTAEGTALRAGIGSIPYGETMTYGALATRTGSVPRAVGQACKTNPYPIIIPCHRVTSASGPEYYSGGGGPRTKTWLIDFEYGNLPPNRRTRLI